MLRTLLSYVSLKSYSKLIGEHDYALKNKFNLFIAFSVTSFLISNVIVIQNFQYYHAFNLISISVIILSIIILVNYFALNHHKNLKLANVIILTLAIMTVHLVSYFTGGIRNSGMVYFGAFILAAFMLLGNKWGRIVMLLSAVNLIYFYILNSAYPEMIVNIMDDGTYHAIDLDYLITYFAAVILIFALSRSLENSKNHIIVKIQESHDELELKNAELSMLSLVASKTENSVVITDADGKMVWANAGFENLTGYLVSEMLGKKPNDYLLGPESESETVFQIREHVRNKQSFNGELKKYRKNGTMFWVHLSQTPIVNDHGEIDKFILVESDITEKKEAEHKMLESYRHMEKVNKELDKFAYIVSHDLKAPLRAISNLTAWIEEDSLDNLSEESKGYFEMIKGRVVRMEALINGILDYSKADRVQNQSLEFDVSDLILETANFTLPADQSKFELTIKSALPLLTTDKTKFSQVISNLIGNAYKHNKDAKPRIEIECIEHDSEYEFIISDNGYGIEKQYHDKIFVIFQTLEARDKFESTGVGLAITKKIVEDAGGQIWVNSEVGQGAAFHFTWPKKEKKSILLEIKEKKITAKAS